MDYNYPMKPLAEVVITDALKLRPARKPQYGSEVRIMRNIASTLRGPTDKLIQRLLNTSRELCRADAAGLSLLEQNGGESIFRWVGLSGTYERYIGGSIPRHGSPCGTCLDKGKPVLYSRPQDYFAIIRAISPQPEETLIIPVYARRKALGTIWIVSHDTRHHFDLEDVRIMKRAAEFLGIALEMKDTEAALRDKEAFNRTIIAASPDCLKIIDKQGRLTFINPYGCALMGIKDVTPFLGKKWVDFWSPDQRAKVRSALRDAKIAGSSQFSGMRPTIQGKPKWWDVIVSPLHNDAEEMLVVSRDITLLKQKEESLNTLNEHLEDRISERTAELKHSNTQLRLLTTKLVDAEAEERAWLAKELHDELGQHLTALKLSLENARADLPDHSTCVHLTRAEETQKILSKQIRNLSFDLRQKFDGGESLPSALETHFERLLKEHKFTVKWDFARPQPPLPSECSRAIFRIVQEALTNVLRHSGARQARVSLRFKKQVALIEVRDAGRGFQFSPAGLREHEGIRGMRERANLLGGTFIIRSRDQKGTFICAEIPLQKTTP